MPMHIAGLAIYDPSTAKGGTVTFKGILEHIRSRMPLVPSYRERMVRVPFDLDHPWWLVDPDFDLEFHVRHIALPQPGDWRQLCIQAARLHARELDLDRPLWEMYVIEGLHDGLIATVTKTHHAAIDGVSGAELTVNLLDLQPEPMETVPDTEWKPDRIPTDLELVGFAASSLARQPILGLKAARRTVEAAVTLRRRNRQPGITPPPAPFAAPRTSFNGAITPHRKFSFVELPLDEVKMVKNALGGTVNDVVLALCAGALRGYLDRQGEQVDAPLIAMVPISVRTEDLKGTMGNQVSQMLVSLATDIDDPVERLRVISESTTGAKEQEKAIGAETLMNWAEFAAPALAARAARLYSNMKLADRHRPLFNVTISNVPGPDFPLYSAGARMVAMYPMGPIMDGGGLNITVMSYMGKMCFGLVACREVIPEVWSIAEGLQSALDELKKAADATR